MRMAELLAGRQPERRLRRSRGAARRVAVAGRGPDAGAAGPQRHRQDHADQHAGRRHAPARRQHRAGRRGAAQAGVAPARRGRHRLGAAGAQHLQVAHGAREPDGGGAARQVDAGARLRDVPAAGRAQGQPGHAAVGRRAADAGRGPRAGASIRGCCCWTSRWKGLAPIIVEELLRAIARITRDEGLSAIIVEQHPQAILAISDSAVVLDHGTVVHAGTAAELRDASRAAGPPARRRAVNGGEVCVESPNRTRRRCRSVSSPGPPARRPFPPGRCGSSCPMRRAAQPTSPRARSARRWPRAAGPARA